MQNPQVTAWLSHASPTPPSTDDRIRLACWQARAVHHAPAAAPARKCAQAAAVPHRGAQAVRACAPPNAPPRAPRAPAAHTSDRVAGAARQQRRDRPPALNAATCKAAASAPPLPTHSLHTDHSSAARAIAAAATQPASHASRQLRRPPGLPPPSAARPCRLC